MGVIARVATLPKDDDMPRDLRLDHNVSLLATAACIDRRSARKALHSGAESLRGLTGVRAADAMSRLGLVRAEPTLPPIDPQKESK